MKLPALSSLIALSTCTLELLATGCSAGADSKAPNLNGAGPGLNIGGAGAGAAPGSNIGGAGAQPGDPPMITIAPVGVGGSGDTGDACKAVVQQAEKQT